MRIERDFAKAIKPSFTQPWLQFAWDMSSHHLLPLKHRLGTVKQRRYCQQSSTPDTTDKYVSVVLNINNGRIDIVTVYLEHDHMPFSTGATSFPKFTAPAMNFSAAYFVTGRRNGI